MRIVVSASGRFHSLHLARQIRRHGALFKFFSAGYNWRDKSYIPEVLVEANSTVSLMDRAYVKFHASRLLSSSKWCVIRDSKFDRWVHKRVTKIGAFDLFVGWGNCSLESIRECQKRGIPTVVESGSMHIEVKEEILRKEFELFGLSAPPIVAKNRETMLKEYVEANFIAVPSKHVYNSFIQAGVPASKLIRVPYGVNVRQFSLPRTYAPPKFQLLFVGQVGIRKGIHHLLEAWIRLDLPVDAAELVIVGDILSDGKKVISQYKLPKNIKFVGGVRQDKLKNLYRNASAFILPSIEEGMAMVIGEAMASSLPVICSDRTGGDEVIENGKQGFVVPVGNIDMLASKIGMFFHNPKLAQEMGKAAFNRIQEFSWEHYGDKIMKKYEEIISTLR